MKNMQKHYYKYRQKPISPIVCLSWDRYKILEIQKARCRNKIEFHKQNVILQSVVSLLCLVGGFYAGQKRSILVPLVLAPAGVASCSALAKHETKRQRYKEILSSLEKE